MDSALTPREIQSRIRAGESLEDVARAAGVPAEDVEGYAAPVLAEREHIASLAQSAQVRRAEGPGVPVALDAAVAPRLEGKGVDPQSVLWDAWRDEDRADRHWTVRISYQSGSAGHEALFDFDPRGRSVSPVNADAQRLVGEQPRRTRPKPRPRTRNDPDAEPTVDLNDELALVRAVQDDETPIIAGGSALAELYAAAAANHSDPGTADPAGDSLRETNGVYDIVPNPPSDMDVLYDMLSGFEEDSVHVYDGLDKPVHLGAPVPDDARHDAPSDDASAHTGDKADAPTTSPPTGGTATTNGTAASGDTTPHARPASAETPAGSSDGPGTTAQSPLMEVDEPAPNPPHPKKPRRRRSHRASVPTWDEIMFGGPRTDAQSAHPHDKQ